ncbi:MAG: S41 family peptidase [Gemmatimonadales bacterium]
MPIIRPSPRRARWVWLVLALALLRPLPAAAQGASYEQLQTFSSLLNQIRINYVDSVSYAQLVRAAVDGVLSSLDPHSRFLRHADGEREMAYQAGLLAGLGITFDEVDAQLVVLSVYPGGPAARKSIAPGDRLITINDTSVAGLSPSDVGLRLLGEKGSKVRLLLERGSRFEPESVAVTLKYDFIRPRSVVGSFMLDGTTGYVRLAEFFAKAGDETERAIKDLKGKGARRIILDLRGNPGGAVVGASDVAGLFLPKGALVFRTVGRRRVMTDQVLTTRDGPFRDLPLIAMVDEGSASASEALVGSLQDHDRALVIGRRSFGKALIMFPLDIPPQGDLVMLVVGRVVTPSGRIIQRAYHGMKAEQYYDFAGTPGASQDTLAVFRTDNGREVRGGGGIAPDVTLPEGLRIPAWLSTAADSGWIEAVSDSVAALLPKEPAGRQAWLAASAEWQRRLVEPFLARVTEHLKLTRQPDDATKERIGRVLAYRAAEVRWGVEAADELWLRSDTGLAAAMGYWDQLPRLLTGR